ncbi:IclR family transcriptional regulator [Neisseriaceae bacterium TC5R-5]|nr:IclR family transcriptional regulator [Neisseriaceae bacterium TC5R-5]
MNDEQQKYLTPGLARGLELLLKFSQQRREMSFSELHALVDMPKASAYRAVQTLEAMGFLQRDVRSNTFSLGMQVLRLGFEYIASLDVVQLGQPIIEALRDQSSYSSHLAIRDGREVVYIARVSAAKSLINQVSIGSRLPVHCTSLGRMLLTDLSRAEFEQLYPSTTLPVDEIYTTSTDRETLWQLVQQDKAQGYVVGESFYRPGISSIVYPVFNRSQQVEAVVSIMIPSKNIPLMQQKKLCDYVATAANKISGLLGATIRPSPINCFSN